MPKAGRGRSCRAGPADWRDGVIPPTKQCRLILENGAAVSNVDGLLPCHGAMRRQFIKHRRMAPRGRGAPPRQVSTPGKPGPLFVTICDHRADAVRVDGGVREPMAVGLMSTATRAAHGLRLCAGQ